MPLNPLLKNSFFLFFLSCFLCRLRADPAPVADKRSARSRRPSALLASYLPFFSLLFGGVFLYPARWLFRLSFFLNLLFKLRGLFLLCSRAKMLPSKALKIDVLIFKKLIILFKVFGFLYAGGAGSPRIARALLCLILRLISRERSSIALNLRPYGKPCLYRKPQTPTQPP